MSGEAVAEYHHLGTYLKEKRAEIGMTQAELSKALNRVHSQFISNWERGLCTPPGHCWEDLIQILKLSRKALVDVMLRDSRTMIEAKIYKKTKKSHSVRAG